MRLKVLFSFVLGCGGYFVFGQQTTNIIPPTPNAMKMTEYVAQRPNMYTGTASVSIPLFTIDFDGMPLPLSLSYNATGIRTNEEASEVGLGWSLSATGVISRTINGGDDLFPGSPTNGHKGYVYNSTAVTFATGYNWKTDATPATSSYYYNLSQAGPDTQPDVFNYNFFGHSGSFLLSQKASTTTVVAVKITQDASSILFDEPTKTFSVITPDGYKGDFTVLEKSTSFSGSTTTTDRMNCCSQSLIDIAGVANNSGRFRTITSWYLSKITSPNGQVITFTYDMNADGSSSYLANTRSFGELAGLTSLQVCMQTVHEHVYLTGILSPEVRVVFSMVDRDDLKKNDIYANSTYFPQTGKNLRRYTGLTITGVDTHSTLNKVITLKQGYFNEQYHDGTDNAYQWLRGRLDRVTIDDEEYRFTYDYGANGVPNKLTNGIDHFGFYNGQDQNSMVLPPDPFSGAFAGGGSSLIDTASTTTDAQYKPQGYRGVVFSYGKAGLLIKVKYPTRGYTVFEYEPHVYLPESTPHFSEYNYQTQSGGNLAGGARIKSIKQYDYNDSLVLSKSYQYVQGTTTTGKLMTPLYNRYAQVFYGTRTFNFMYRTFSSIPGNSSAEGKIIGYSKVQETVTGKSDSYTNTYTFENRPNKTLSFNSVAVGYPNLNGQAIETRNYNSSGKIVQRTLNQDYYHLLDSVKAISYEQAPGVGGGFSLYLNYIVFYTVKKTFNTPYMITTTVADQPSSITEDGNGNIMFLGNSLQTEKKLTYDSNYLLSSEQIKNSMGDSILTQYKRPRDYAGYSTLAHMILPTVNMLNPVVEQIVKKNGTIISATANRYYYDSPNNKVNLTTTYAFNRNLGTFQATIDGNTFPPPYEKKTDFTYYDTQTGKLLEYTSADGLTNSFIWGYNKKLPIAHGVGITNYLLNQAYLADTVNYETTLRNHANLVGKQVTTYAHNPLVGILRVTDPSGLKKSFEYDSYSRLQATRDNKGQVVSQNKYHFKSMPLTRIISLSGPINFGTFYSCNVPTQPAILTISNLGDDDFTVTSIGLPVGFTAGWSSGVVSAGTSINVPINFIGTTAGTTYSGTVTVNTLSTTGANTTTASAIYAPQGTTRVISMTSPISIPTYHQNTYVTITNNGNDCLSITGISYPTTSNWSASLSIPASGVLLVLPGQSVTMTIMRLQGTENLDVTVLSNKTSGNEVLHVTP